MSSVYVVTFYEIAYIEKYKKLSRDLARLGTKENLTGTFFSTPQGVNGTLAGTKEGLNKIVSLMQDSYGLKEFKPTWSKSLKNPFKRFKVKLKERLLPLEGDFDPVRERGEHVDSKSWNEIIADKNTIVLDVRNKYETEIGSFKGSIVSQTDHFIDFPDFVDSNLDSKDKKKIAMFCTGGIRCEIASSYLISQGFEDVCQLEGGVLKYLENVEQDDQLWEGECFVFDERVSVNGALEQGNFIQCFGCRRPLVPEEINSKFYVKGVSCRFCYNESSDLDKERFAQRQKQIDLANQRGHKHMGVESKQSNE